jgi:small-conductance mechanosensitive channel
MAPPPLLQDFVSLMLLLAPSAALICLVLAGLNFRRDVGGAAIIGGGFSRWIFWAVVFITIPGLISWFPSFGVGPSLPGNPSISTPWLAAIQTDLSNFVTNFVVGKLTTVLAAFFVLHALLDLIQGGNPLLAILGTMFLLAIQTTYSLLQGWNTGTQFATIDVLGSLWTYIAATLCPIAAVLGIVGAIINFASHRPVKPMIVAVIGFLTVAGLWKLILVMM